MLPLILLEPRERVNTGDKVSRLRIDTIKLILYYYASRYDRQGHYHPPPAKSISRLRTKTKGNDLL